MTLPSECEPFLLRSGGSSNLTEHGGTKGAAAHGGHWSACTHLKSYGLNVDFGVLNMLLALQPRSSLELGSGMGLYTTWLHKMAGTSPAIGIEPNPLMRPLLAAQGPNSSPGLVQLVANVINASGQAAACERALPKFDVVFSVNMAEHLPLHTHGAIADVLARHTHGFLLFAAGVPGSQGIGHIGNRPIHEWAALFEARGLVHLPRTSIKVRAPRPATWRTAGPFRCSPLPRRRSGEDGMRGMPRGGRRPSRRGAVLDSHHRNGHGWQAESVASRYLQR